MAVLERFSEREPDYWRYRTRPESGSEVAAASLRPAVAGRPPQSEQLAQPPRQGGQGRR